MPENERLLLDVDCFGNCPFGERSRAKPFDRVVFAANDKVRAVEYSDGGFIARLERIVVTAVGR